MSLTSKLISQMTGSETMSMMSGFDNYDNASMDSGPDSEFNFEKMDQESKNEEEKESKDVDHEPINVDNKKIAA